MNPVLPIAKPLLGEEEAEAAARVVRSGWVMQGPEVLAFEAEFAVFSGAPHAVALSSGTAALQLALLALGIGPGDEVITVSHSYIASANSVRLCGATPVFVDIEARGFNIDAAQIEAAITPATRAVLCVHQLGMPCELMRIAALCRARGLFLVEDAACAAGSEVAWAATPGGGAGWQESPASWQRIGRPHGDIACFSFHPRKIITTGDGGMLVTANPEWERSARLLRQHGMRGADAAAERVGFNFRMTDVQAAIGRVQLRRLPSLLAERRLQAERYRQLLEPEESILVPLEPSYARSNWQSYCVELSDGNPAAIRQALDAQGIATRLGVMNAHEEPAYGGYTVKLPNSERARRRGLMLPLFPGMTDADQERVVTALLAELH